MADRQLAVLAAAVRARVRRRQRSAPWSARGIEVVPDRVVRHRAAGGRSRPRSPRPAIATRSSAWPAICRSWRRRCSRRCATARPRPRRWRPARRGRAEPLCARYARALRCRSSTPAWRAGRLALHELLEQTRRSTGSPERSWPRWIRTAAASSTSTRPTIFAAPTRWPPRAVTREATAVALALGGAAAGRRRAVLHGDDVPRRRPPLPRRSRATRRNPVPRRSSATRTAASTTGRCRCWSGGCWAGPGMRRSPFAALALGLHAGAAALTRSPAARARPPDRRRVRRGAS